MLATAVLYFLADIDEHDLDVNRIRRWRVAFNRSRNQIYSIVEIEFFDRGELRYAIGTEYQIQRLAHRALTDVVGAHYEAVAIEVYFCGLDATKVPDLQTYYFHAPHPCSQIRSAPTLCDHSNA